MTGGHKFTCGHVRHCGDHVQMVEERVECYACRNLQKIFKKNGLQPFEVKHLIKDIVDECMQEDIW